MTAFNKNHKTSVGCDVERYGSPFPVGGCVNGEAAAQSSTAAPVISLWATHPRASKQGLEATLLHSLHSCSDRVGFCSSVDGEGGSSIRTQGWTDKRDWGRVRGDIT